jgi:hypothetical protein
MKNKQHITLVSIMRHIIMPILLLSACNNKQIYPYPHPMECGNGKDESKLCIPQEVLDYCYFKTGSYWVYRDSLTGVKDCVYVTRNSIIEIDNRAQSGINDRRILQRMNVDMIHSYDQFRENFTTTVNVPGFNANIQQSISGSGFVGGRQHFTYPYILNVNFNKSSPYQVIISKIQTIIINTKNYGDIFKIFLERDGSVRKSNVDASPEHTYYLARNIGLVKNVIKVLDTNNSQNTFSRVWLLEKYKVLQ